MRRWLLVVVVVLIWAGHGTTEAREIRQGDQCLVGVDETIQGDLFVLCRTLTIRGHVVGNVIGAAGDAEITGIIDGDVYLAAGQLNMAGTLGGNLHFAGPVLRILPSTHFDNERAHLISLSLSTLLDQGVLIPASVTAAGYQLVLNGQTGGEVNFWGSALTVKGNVGGDVNAVVGDPASTGISQLQTLLGPFNWDIELINPGLVLTDNAVVGGNVSYSGPVEGSVKGQIAGKTVFTQTTTQPDLTQIISEQESAGVYLSQAAREFVILFLSGLIGLTLMPRPLLAPIRHIQSRPLPSVSMGLLAFIVSFPIALSFLFFIVVLMVILILLRLDGLVIALLGGALVGTWSGALSVFYFTAIFISRVVVCLVVGRGFARLAQRDDSRPGMSYISLALGAIVLGLLMSLPVVGLIISAIAAFLGLGAILIVLQAQFRAYRESLVGLSPRVSSTFSQRIDGMRALPPPALDDEPKPPGMENLPEGFRWWDRE